MKPEGTRVWRKNGREVVRGVPQGRRTTHRVRTESPRDNSERRHTVAAQETSQS